MALPNLILAWQGIPGDDSLYWITSPLGANGAPSFQYPQSKVGAVGFGTSTRPTIIRFVNGADGPTLGLAWKGVGSDGTIYSSFYRGNPTGQAATYWANPHPLIGGTTWGPACTPFNNGLFFAWKGTGSDTGIWGNLDGPAPGQHQAQFVTGIRSALSPAIVTFGNQMIMVWRGEGGIDGLFWAITSNGTGWSHMGAIADAATTDIPSLITFNGQVWLAFKGLDTNIYMTNIVDVGDLPANKAQWRPRWVVPGIGTSNGPSLCALGDQLFMAWKGAGNDTSIWYSQSRTGAANAWATAGALQKSIPGVGTSYGPAVFSYTG